MSSRANLGAIADREIESIGVTIEVGAGDDAILYEVRVTPYLSSTDVKVEGGMTLDPAQCSMVESFAVWHARALRDDFADLGERNSETQAAGDAIDDTREFMRDA